VLPPPCDHAVPQPAICESCARRARQRRARIRAIVLAFALVLACGGIAVALSMHEPRKEPVPVEAGDPLEQYKRERVAQLGCDHDANFDLVDYLIQNKRFELAATAAAAAVKKCGPLGEMRWRLSFSLTQLHRWREATAVTTELINEKPPSPIFWAWRGEDHAGGNQLELALVDFRQSIAYATFDRAAEPALAQIDVLADEPPQRCERARAWRYYARQLGGMVAREERAGDAACDAGSKGRAKLVRGSNIAVKLGGGVKADLALDPTAGTTILSRELATKAGITPTAADSTTTMWSQLTMISGQPGHAPHITVGGATAEDVSVLITDDPAAGDGVIGLSFLWHFDITSDAKQVTISAPVP
jgi:aspartyl protease